MPDHPETLPVAEARRNEPAAWEALFRRFQLPLYTYAADLLRDSEAAFDIVQETFVRAVRHLPGLREDRRFGSWLFGIAHQLVLQSWRRSGRQPFSSDPIPEDAPATEPEPDSALVQREDRERLLSLLDALPDAFRSVILLHYLEDFPLTEIAAITEVPVGTVKSRLHHARRLLRAAWEIPALPAHPLPQSSHESHA